MASSELLLISKVIESKEIDAAIDMGVKSYHFTKWADMWEWIVSYYRTHDAVPTERALVKEYGSVTLEDTDGEVTARLVEELINSYRRRTLIDGIQQMASAIDGDDMSEVVTLMSETIQKATVEASRMRDVDIIQNWQTRLDLYRQMSEDPSKNLGISTGFHGLDHITNGGFRPQQFVVFAGEPKRGKSLFALVFANSAHMSGRVPLFVSFEMSIVEQTARYDSIRAKIPYSRILSGDLNDKDLKTIERMMMLSKNMQPYYITEDTSSLTTVSALSSKVKEKKPNILIVDGVYLMDDEEGQEKGSPQALTNITRGLKRLAQHHDIPVVATTQVLPWKVQNRKTRAVTADAIGYSSSFGQDADLLMSVERNPDIDDQAILRVIMSRASRMGEVHVRWDWNTMEFEEVTDYDDDIGASFD